MSGPDAEAYRERLEEILLRREFQASPRELGYDPADLLPEGREIRFPDWLKEHLLDVLRTVSDWVGWVWDRLFPPDRPGESEGGGILSAFSEPTAWGICAGAAILLGLVLWRTLRRTPAACASGARTEAVGEAMPDALSRPAEAWTRFAEEFARDGRWALALRSLYLSLLVRLHQRGTIRYERERTNGEYAAALAAGPAGSPFSRLTLLFDVAWYGGKPLDEPRYREAIAWAHEVDEATDRRSASRPGATPRAAGGEAAP